MFAGTALGDPIELNALQKVFIGHENKLCDQVYLSTAKASIGHTEASSGLVSEKISHKRKPKFIRKSRRTRDLFFTSKIFHATSTNEIQLSPLDQ